VALQQPPRPGLSAPIVTSIPNIWSAEWFRRWITNFLTGLSQASSGFGITVVATGASPSVISVNTTQLAGNPTAKVELTPVNGVATTFLRSDSAPPIDQAITPTWTGHHIWYVSATFNGGLTGSTAALTGALGVNGKSPPAQVTGFGTPTGAGVIANFPGASATLPQATQAIAQLITDLKAIGFYGA
jgi:hypothetical protein